LDNLRTRPPSDIEPQPNLVIEGIAALHPNIGARADLYLG
jgi:hypothetical protein